MELEVKGCWYTNRVIHGLAHRTTDMFIYVLRSGTSGITVGEILLHV